MNLIKGYVSIYVNDVYQGVAWRHEDLKNKNIYMVFKILTEPSWQKFARPNDDERTEPKFGSLKILKKANITQWLTQ